MYLAHEVGDDAVEGGTLEAVSLLAGAQGAEVLGGLGDHVSSQLHDNPAEGAPSAVMSKKTRGVATFMKIT